jgi:hypothetical protein
MKSEAQPIRWIFEPSKTLLEKDGPEATFLESWQRHMGGAIQSPDVWEVEHNSGSYPFCDVVQKAVPDERDARLATDMIVWLASEDGAIFLEKADHFIKLGVMPVEAYSCAWASLNAKRFISARRPPRQALCAGAMEYEGNVSIEDADTLDAVAFWLCSVEGQDFLSGFVHRYNRGS